MEDDRYLYALLGATVGCMAGVGLLTGVLFYWFNPAGVDCSFNVSVIVSSLMLAIVLPAASLHPKVSNSSLFPATAVSLYCTYLCYSAMQSEPHDYECNSLGRRMNAASGSTLALGMLVTLASVVWSALRVGSNTDSFLGGSSSEVGQPLLEVAEIGGMNDEGTSAGLDGEAPQQQPPMVAGGKVRGVAMEDFEVTTYNYAWFHLVLWRHTTHFWGIILFCTGGKARGVAMEDFEVVTYNYAWFHLVFSLASMYIAMLMTGWGSEAEEKSFLDVSWLSVGVKLATEFITAALFVWTLVVPTIFPDRSFV